MEIQHFRDPVPESLLEDELTVVRDHCPERISIVPNEFPDGTMFPSYGAFRAADPLVYFKTPNL